MQCQRNSKEGISINTAILDTFDKIKDIENLKRAAEIIKNGGTVAFPTETVYGLGANALDIDAVKKIFAAKGRPQDNPLIVHVDSLEMMYPLVDGFDDKAQKLANAFWPGPLTIIMKRNPSVPKEVSAGLDTLAIRMPSDEIARELIRLSGLPIAAPSANLSGSPSPTTSNRVISDLGGRVDAILNSHNCQVGLESTVITLVGDKPRLLRPGFITVEQLEAVLGEIVVDKAVYQSISMDEKVSAPGMKYKHYAPKAPVVVLKGSFDKFKEYISTVKDKKIVAMCFNGEAKSLQVDAIEYGCENDSIQQANLLFEALHKVDEMGAEIVFARCPDCKGVGLAVSNRLFKAAGFEVIEL